MKRCAFFAEAVQEANTEAAAQGSTLRERSAAAGQRGGRFPSDPEELSVSRAGRLYGRALRLHCPHCGTRGLRQSPLRLHRRCSGCGLRTERAEEDFFLGAMMLNLVLSEGLLALLIVATVVVAWPAVPWNLLWIGGIVLMALAPFLFYPLSHALWLATDILIRPVTEAEMEWHRTHAADELRPMHER